MLTVRLAMVVNRPTRVPDTSTSWPRLTEVCDGVPRIHKGATCPPTVTVSVSLSCAKAGLVSDNPIATKAVFIGRFIVLLPLVAQWQANGRRQRDKDLTLIATGDQKAVCRAARCRKRHDHVACKQTYGRVVACTGTD
jgi:hypothetical protein